ncbi:hypothetical protein PG994_014422 [Apiospora phragmitis]|uniref:F-box domain-containing protein n=1 Tax=Apiospora phragmitis TaxID=2905665 RepID=A0ABR1T482_9PEZI
MSSGMFASLPTELLGEIERALPFQDRLRLSAVDSRLRQYFAPNLYSTIRFSNRLADRDAIAHVVAKFGTYARALTLTLDLAVPDLEGAWASPGLPVFTRDLLRGKTLPGISSFSIRFTADPDSKVGFRAPTSFDEWAEFQGLHPTDELTIAESETNWRQCLTATWQALVDNPGTIRHLALRNLIPVVSSAWLTPAWHAFVGRLESLALGFWDSEWVVDRQDEFDVGGLEECMDEWFYVHATALRRLEFVANPGQPYATALWGTLSSALGTDLPNLPSLRELRIVNCIISEELAALIAARVLSRLHRVELVDCVSGAPYAPNFGSQDLYWLSFFRSILRYLHGDRGRRWNEAVSSILASGRSLLDLEAFEMVQSEQVELVEMDEGEVYEQEKKSPGFFHSAVQRAQMKLWAQEVNDRIRQLQDQGHKVNQAEHIFRYIYRDSRSGLVGPCAKITASQAAKGNDAMAYQELMDFVKSSREQAKDATFQA